MIKLLEWTDFICTNYYQATFGQLFVDLSWPYYKALANSKQRWFFVAMVVAQLAERSFPTPKGVWFEPIQRLNLKKKQLTFHYRID